ncbi:MAG TPA: thiamine pyrophosphate-binding protein, partial [Casimicrobiaceae bacterium]|nr:thiamine pyrophosphate-binding protein [Casimicrobiaceae bacterium]
TPRQGPVALNLPRNLLAETIDAPDLRSLAERGPPAPPEGNADAITRAARMLAGAKRPLILAGGGVKNGRSARDAIELAERLSAPMAMSPGHGDAVSCTHPLYAGQVGPRGNAVASDLARRADVILALGTRLGFNTTFYTYDHLNAAAQIIQVEIEPTAIARFFPVALGVVGDAGRVARQLTAALAGASLQGESTWASEFQSKRRALLTERDESARLADPLQPAALYKVMRAVLPDDTMYTMDAGTLCLQATDQMRYVRPPALFTPLDFGLVGFSYACGLGVKLACPDRTVVSLMGDGGFGMTSSELGTAVQYDIRTVCVVMNNGCWGAEKAYQRDFFGGRYIGADVPNPPYDQLARLWGAEGFRADRAEEVERALRAALACGRPAVVDVRVDPNALYSFRRDSFKHRSQS